MALLEVRDLRTYFQTDAGQARAVDGVSFHVDRGEVLGIDALAPPGEVCFRSRSQSKRYTYQCRDPDRDEANQQRYPGTVHNPAQRIPPDAVRPEPVGRRGGGNPVRHIALEWVMGRDHRSQNRDDDDSRHDNQPEGRQFVAPPECQLPPGPLTPGVFEVRARQYISS
jgi:hypothetical protein